jgi:hypothetical protein
MQRPARIPTETPGLFHDLDLVVDVICMRHDGIKLTPQELRGELPRRGHLHVDQGGARLMNGSGGPATVDDVIPPLGHAHLYRVSDAAWVLHGYEHPYGLPAQKQAWYCTLVH